MQIEPTRKLFAVDEYYRMADAGILTRDDRVELIDGEIVRMSPIGIGHAGCVNAATRLFAGAFEGRAVVSVQNPLRLDDYTEPQPDVVLLKFREDSYRGKRPEASDALLLVEVADTTLAYDRDVKLPRYAASGVPEVWIEDLSGGVLLVYREPSESVYRTRLRLRRGDSVSVASMPDPVFGVRDLIG